MIYLSNSFAVTFFLIKLDAPDVFRVEAGLLEAKVDIMIQS